MSFATLNSNPVLAARLAMPPVGAWTAEVSVDAQEALSGAATLAVGGVEWRGTAFSAGVFGDVAKLRLVGGAGGLAREVEPKFYRSATVKLVLEEALAAVGERLSSSSDPNLMARIVPTWSRAAGRASEALRAIVDELGAVWRVLRDGSVWVGFETWPAVEFDHQVLDEDPRSGRIEMGCEAPSLVPGVSLGGRKVARVEVRLQAAELRVLAWVEGSREADDPGRALAAMVASLTAGSIYLGQFPARVVAQNADGTLELKPDDSRIPGMSKVPIRYGIPGVEARVAAGARVAIEFEAGDPARPVATVWESGGLVELVLAGGTKEVARKDDATSSGKLKMTAVAAQGVTDISFIWLSENMVPTVIGTIALTTAGGTAAAVDTASITGQITEGATKVKA